jgi:hypothetical protein
LSDFLVVQPQHSNSKQQADEDQLDTLAKLPTLAQRLVTRHSVCALWPSPEQTGTVNEKSLKGHLSDFF